MNIIYKIAQLCILTVICLTAISCGDDAVPKPKAYLRLDYPLGEYSTFDDGCPYSFSVNTLSRVRSKGNCNYVIEYPRMKASIYITYKPVQGNLTSLLRDAQKLTYEHVIKADEIQERPYSNALGRVHGMFYQVGGNAATNAQFYVTDSTRHFLTGSVYFYAKPNFDSVMPAASYIKDDMQNIMETIKWK